MQLRIWLAQRRLRHLDFAAQVGIRPQHLSAILCKGIVPRLPLIRAIEKATQGEVTAADLIAAQMDIRGFDAASG